ncbi:NAD-dependent epimerase/dehydratase family protein [Sulfitobacter sp. S190]|uniref:NAD-dependent epimerase/dehydratase family protein n=1 Tax=Sulfitobacter sp. S190 TaxID=2867022 RepID=UPI0021A814E5|nr:NAD-dependent epimerase/dehydratase family protein [Sulfitobacter sp. S190]UWR21587.1 NAD-dependent epimerase/dehydratase family protein [Sulfitobacter sp. S190]
MSRTVFILGAKGRFGRAATTAFANAGWRVVAVSRDGLPVPGVAQVETIACDVTDAAALEHICAPADVIVHAVNPPYPAWKALLPVTTKNVIRAALAAKATVMVPGNVYNYGADAPADLTEDTPFVPTSRKGVLRVEMENAFADAASRGLRTIVLRGGDFIEAAKTGNWFDSQIINRVDRGIFTYPGRVDAMHAWAYLPDMARALVGLAERRETLRGFEQFNFEGFSLTGAELQSAIEAQIGGSLRHKTIPWPLIRVMGIASPLMREVAEMRYLWDVPHRLADSKLRAFLPRFTATPLGAAMDDVFLGAPAAGQPLRPMAAAE